MEMLTEIWQEIRRRESSLNLYPLLILLLFLKFKILISLSS